MPWVERLHGFLWGLTIDWVALVGVFLTLGLQFLPLRRLPWACRQLLDAMRDRRSGPGEISSFGALMTALGGTIGMGHLTGMTIAMTAGGPGVVPWMWLVALLGMATKFSETFLAVRFRQRTPRGEVVGGPMEAIRHGLGPRWNGLAMLYAALGTLGVFGLGNGVQAQELTLSLQQLSGLPSLGLGMATAALAWVVLRGGLARLSRVQTVLVPLMALPYLLVVALLLARHAALVPAAVTLMLRQAFTPQALSGSGLGLVVHIAVRTAVFANEAGLGTTAIAQAPACPADPVRQGAIAMLANLISMLICSATALLLLISGVLHRSGPDGVFLLADRGGLMLLRRAFDWAAPGSAWIASLALVLFAFTTILTYGYYGERCFTFLVGARGGPPFRLLWTLVVVLASSQAVRGLWAISNTLDALIALPNLLALLLLSGLVFQAVVTLPPPPGALPHGHGAGGAGGHP